MNIEEKPWDSFVLFAPEKMMEQDTEDYFFYGSDEYALLCALDRIFDDATVFTIKGESFRGKKLETVALQTSRVKAPASSEKPTP